MNARKNLMQWVAVLALVLPLILAGTAGAAVYDGVSQRGVFLPDGTKEISVGTYINPDDGFCVIGIAADGNMLVDWSIKTNRDCEVYTGVLSGMTTTTQCTVANAPGNDGYKHAWSTRICMNGDNAVSLVDLDRTVMGSAMCKAKGGAIVYTGKCVAYGWQYRNRKADGTLPVTGTGISITKGPSASDNLGFCRQSMKMTLVSGFANLAPGGCPAYHNSATTDPNGWYTGPLNTSADALQYQSSYDAGLGWTTWKTSNPWPAVQTNECGYDNGVKGYLLNNVTRVDGTPGPVRGTFADLTAYTTMGDCLANGYLWDNWLPMGDGSGANGNASVISFTTGTETSQIVKFDAITTAKNGGANFYNNACQRCHSDQSREFVTRNKPGYINTGHKKAGDKAKWATVSDDYGVKGVTCVVCHSSAMTYREDNLRVSATTGLPVPTSHHNTLIMGVTQLCFSCHGTMPADPAVNPASVIPVSAGDFSETAKGLAPIGNQFLNSPHAKYNYTGATASAQKAGLASKASTTMGSSYNSTFIGRVCRSSGLPWDRNILTTVFQSGAAKTIPFNDLTTNTDCTNPGVVSAMSGAAGYWGPEGKSADDSQGNCSTCHDIHWSLDGDSNPKAAPIRRECETCHVVPGTKANSASGAPQVSASINHPTTGGTPFDTNIFKNACEVCHMPKASSGGSAAHLWRINTSATYTTMGTSAVNFDNDNLAWLDVDLACGQCHGGSAGTLGTKHGAMYKTKAQLAAQATWMHAGSDCKTPTAASTITPVGTVVTLADTSANATSVSINWGDGNSAVMSAGTTTVHTYSTRVATYTIKQTVTGNCDSYNTKIVKQLVAPVQAIVTVTVNGGANVTLALKKKNPNSSKVGTIAVHKNINSSDTFSVADGIYFVTCKGGTTGMFTVAAPAPSAVSLICN